MDADSRRGALALMLTGEAKETAPAVDQFLRFAESAKLCLDDLWIAERDGQPIVASLIVPSPGRTAMLFLSPVRHCQDLPVASEVIRCATFRQDHRETCLIQTLLDPSQQIERQALLTAGFKDLAQLRYMRCDVAGRGVPLQLHHSIQMVNWKRSHRPLFASATEASYQDTLDCPGLLGLRHIDDVLDGHMATGQFIPDLWFALRCGGDPVGVMLMSRVPHGCGIELVYLGITPAWRRRHLGRHLVNHGLWLAPRYDASEMVLAVDENNTPAMVLYRSIGFTQIAHKLTMIFTLQ